MKVKFMY